MYVLLTVQRWGCNYEPLMKFGLHFRYNYVKKNTRFLLGKVQLVVSFNV